MNLEKIEEIKEEIIDTLTEGVHNSRYDLLVCYHSVGNLVKEAEEEGVKVSYLSKELGKHERTVYRCYQFVKKFPSLDEIPDGKNCSWTKILKLLPKETKEKPSLDQKIKQFIVDMYPAETPLRKELILNAITDWEHWR